MKYAIETINVCKYFGKLKANDNISLKIEAGKVHAICGENGAGKSTLMNVLYGLYLPTSGQLKVNGEEVHFKTSKDAIAKGVGMVHQHFMLIQNLTVAENIVLGQEPGGLLKFNRAQAIKEVEELSKKYNLYVDPRALISDISVGMQQRVEILKALYRGVEILILDEPTAVLAPQEIEELFASVRFLISTGKTVIIITHKLNEVLEISHDISVLRQGCLVGTIKTETASKTEITRMMVDRDVSLGGSERKQTSKNEKVLDIEHVTLEKGLKRVLDNLSLSVHAGEIVGIAGVDGNGQSELIDIIGGKIKNYQGEVNINNVNTKKLTIRQIKENQMGFIPEDRHKDGLIMDFTLANNMILGQHYHEPFAKNAILNEGEIEKNALAGIQAFDIRALSHESLASELSGGNQQKIILAREMKKQPKFILASQPTRGLDVGAIEFVHNHLVDARNNEQGILLVSFELEEILELCDRIYVMNEGRITGEVQKADFDIQLIGKMMLGLEGM